MQAAYESAPRRRAAFGLGAFFLLMLLLTLGARSLAALSIAQVETTTAQRATLTRRVQGQGTLSSARETLLFVQEALTGIYVEHIEAQTGMTVSMGDPIARLSVAQVQQRLASAQEELETLQLAAKQQAQAPIQNQALEQEKARREQAAAQRRRASQKEAAQEAVAQAELALEEAQEAVDAKRIAVEEAQRQMLTQESQAHGERVQTAQEALAQADAALEQALWNRQTSLISYQRSVEDAQAALDDAQAAAQQDPDDAQKQRALLDAQSALARAQEDLAIRQADLDRAVDAATRQRDQALGALSVQQQDPGNAASAADPVALAREALVQAEKAVTQAERGLKSAQDALAALAYEHEDEIWLENYAQQQARLEASAQTAAAQESQRQQNRQNEREVAQLEARITALETILQNGGTLTSPAGGVLTGVRLEQGTPAGDLLASIAPAGTSYLLECRVTAQQGQYCAAGDAASVTLAGIARAMDAQIHSVRADASDPDWTVLVLEVPYDAQGAHFGASATVTLEKQTQLYDCVVPRSAVREGSEGTFVLVMRAGQDGSTRAEHISVEVVDSDESMCAVRGLNQGERVIQASNKPVSAGDSVQLMRVP